MERPDALDDRADGLAGLISRLGRSQPDAPALLAPGRPPLAYGALAGFISDFGALLRAAGLARADRVALVLPNGPEAASAFLATAAHTCCAPLNPAYSATDFEFYLSDLNAKAIVLPHDMQTPAREVAVTLGIPVLDAISDPAEAAGLFRLADLTVPQPTAEAVSGARPADVALLLHTSGTTGRPKIVPLTHGNVCASAANIGRSLALSAEDRCLNVMPLFHIHGLIAGLLSPLVAGGSVICTPGFEEHAFFDWLDAFSPTWYTAVPTIHQAVVAGAHGVSGNSSLRFVRSSSSPLPPKVMRDLHATFQVPVVEAYGMTEAAHQMTTNPLSDGGQRAGSVGLPAGPEVIVLGEDGNESQIGQVGEIAIRGSNVTSGYENNPEANQAAYTNGWFRTGDQGYFDPDGYLYLEGRLKEIINRGGEKVSPREIDDVLTEHPDVQQAVAFGVPHETLGEDVAAAAVLKPAAAADEAELRAFCFERMAAFKVPSRIVLVDTIPKGQSGKLQRIGLAEVLGDRLQSRFDLPQTRVESLIAELFEEVNGGVRVGVNDNFFALGGDSIRGVQVVSRIRAMLQVEISPVAVFRHPTVALLAVEVSRAADELFGESIEDILAEIAALTDEEAEALLRSPDDGQSAPTRPVDGRAGRARE